MLHQPFDGSIERMPEPSTPAPHPAKTLSRGIGHGLEQVAPHRVAHERVAITGMGVLNALGKAPEEVWASCLAMKSGITLVPSSRWDHDVFMIPDRSFRARLTARLAPSWTFIYPATRSGSPHMISDP